MKTEQELVAKLEEKNLINEDEAIKLLYEWTKTGVIDLPLFRTGIICISHRTFSNRERKES